MINEQYYSFTASDYTEAVSKIKEILASALNWIADTVEDVVYSDAEKKTGVRFSASASSAIAVEGINKYTATQSSRAFVWANNTIYVHQSSDGQTQYVSFGETAGFIFAKDENGMRYIIMASAASNLNVLGENETTFVVLSYRGKVNDRTKYSVQRMPSIIYGGSFPSLYNVLTVPIGQPRNQLVEMKRKVYRIIYLTGASTNPEFAIPVGLQEGET